MAILMVDDSEDQRRLLHAFLRGAGHGDLVEAASAREAFERLGMDSPSGPDPGIELVLLDVQMPGLDGIEACRRIKAVERLRDVPVIMVTAMDDVASVSAAFAAGAMDYVAKPFRKEELLARVGSALRLRAGIRALEERNRELSRALEEIKTLQGLVPICAWCKNIRDDQGYWQTVEAYVQTRTEATFSHGICPVCTAKVLKEAQGTI